MSTVKEVLERYHAKVPFPITPNKIEAAGYTVEEYLTSLCQDIKDADDSDSPRFRSFLDELERIQRS